MDVTEEVDEFLKTMEEKYHISDQSVHHEDLENQLHILSRELETIGFSPIDLKQTTTNLMEQIVGHTLLLIEVHRRSLSKITDMNVHNMQKDTKNTLLQKAINALQTKVRQLENENNKLQLDIKKLDDECKSFKKNILTHRKEVESMKRLFNTKENGLIHNINSLKHENDRLREMCGQNLENQFSKEENLLRILKKYRHQEEIYKSTLKKLEENNAEIMNEILNLRTELAVVYSKDKTT